MSVLKPMLGEAAPDEPRLLFFPGDAISLKEAAGRTRQSRRSGWDIKTTRAFVKKLGLGRCAIGGRRIEVHAVAFEMAIHGDAVALDLLRAGRRADPHVQRYVRHCGLGD